MSKSPYGVGYYGHARICDCDRCAKMRLAVYDEKVRHMLEMPEFPADNEPVVPVRAHFRKVRGFLSKYPRTRAAISNYIRKVK